MSLRRSAATQEVSGVDVTQVRRYAWRSLAVVIAILVLVQVASVPAGLAAFGQVYGGADAHSTWQAYLASPVPEVLFLGASDTRADVDPQEVSRILSTAAGRPVSVGKLGIVGEGPDFFEALAYRVMSRPQHPRLLALSLGMIEFNSSYVYDPTADLWQVSDPIDYGFMRLAYRVDPYRERLLTDWLLPYFASYRPLGTAVQCQFKAFTNDIKQRLSRRVLPADPTTCDQNRAESQNQVMTEPVQMRMDQLYHDVYLRNFRFDERQASNVTNLVAMVKNQGAAVVLLRLPNYQTSRLYPAAELVFDARLHQLATMAGVSLSDFMGQFETSPDLWSDPIHLNRAGAQAIAPMLSAAILDSGALPPR